MQQLSLAECRQIQGGGWLDALKKAADDTADDDLTAGDAIVGLTTGIGAVAGGVLVGGGTLGTMAPSGVAGGAAAGAAAGVAIRAGFGL